MTMSNQVHVVDPDLRRRAHIAFQLAQSALRTEVYESLDEFATFSPGGGFVLLNNDGEEQVLQRLHEYFHARGQFLPVAVYSSGLNVRHVVECIQRGAADYLVWPFGLDDVVSAINRSARLAQETAWTQSRQASACLKVAQLTPRERQVLACMVDGRSNRDIAEHLEISSRTVEIHRANAIRKLDASTTAEAVRIGIYAGLELT